MSTLISSSKYIDIALSKSITTHILIDNTWKYVLIIDIDVKKISIAPMYDLFFVWMEMFFFSTGIL